MKIDSEEAMLGYGRKLARKILEKGNSRQTSKKEDSKEVQDDGVVIELVGDVGVGKTTLVRGLAEGLGVAEAVTSPSFTISKAYALSNGGRLVHYDFYRLKEPGLMMEDLAENLRDERNIVVIEWGESVEEVLPEKHPRIVILYNDDGTREVSFNDGEKMR